MKPTKNQFFCNDCSKIKMRFETEDKANRFLKFNGDEIEAEAGVRPIRSYYCIACNSWHVTSKNRDFRIEKSRTEIVLDQFYQDTNENKHLESKAIEIKTEEKKQKGNQLQPKDIILQETKSKREELNIQLKAIELNIEMISTLKKYEKPEGCVEILNDVFAILEDFKTTISELEHIYDNIFSKEEMEHMFRSRIKRSQNIESKLTLLKQELTNAMKQ